MKSYLTMKRPLFLILMAVVSLVNTHAFAKRNARLTEDEIKAEIAKASEYQSYLNNLFDDLSCSKLKGGITVDNLPSNDNFKKLSAPLQEMVMKIASNDWQEDYSDLNLKEKYPLLDEDAWDDNYAKKYRVQDYEPYSESTASELVGVSRYTNMNNPTGIVGDKGDVIYVFVKDAVPQGATLYINEVWNPAEMYNNATAGTQLKQGLNILSCKNDNAHFFIYYCVQTTKQSNGKYVADESHNLKNYKPITIHIEGGRLNGFFNYVGDSLYVGDTQKDFEYTVQRATHPMYNLIGKNVILHFHLEDSPAVVGESHLYPCVKTVLFRNKGQNADREYDPVKILTAWDQMCLTERILMGLQSDDDVRDPYNKSLYEPNSAPCNVVAGGQTYKVSPGFQYNEYFNNKLFGMSRQSEGLFMSAGDWRTSYNVYTIEAVLTQFNKGDIWGPAHEYGHMNQRLINMAGTTEESNNIFSNVVVYYQGKNTSRSDFISNQFKIFQEGKPFLENDTWGTTRMFWQLWCYYHATGHNKKFYPRLFELLRNYPIVKTIRPGKHNERYDKLQFAKMCCLAAEEDLTDFFTAWGFFVPLELYTFADYNTYDTFLTEEDIKAVKEEIAAFGFEQNDAIIFIDDRVNSERLSYDGFPKEKAGDFGGFDAFINNRAPSGDFGYSVDINTVTVSTDGDPGAGFIIKDKEGNLLGFSNSKTFVVNDELAEKLRTGEAIMEAVGANNETKKVVNLISDGPIKDKIAILKRLYASASGLLDYVDPTQTKVGYLLEAKTVSLKSLLDDIDRVLQEENPSTEKISEYINNLTDEFNRITGDEEAFIGLETGSLYLLTNSARRLTDALTFNNNICSMAAKPAKPGDKSAAKFQWNFISAPDDDTYYIQNWENKAFLDKATNGSQTIPLQFSGGYKYNLIPAREKNEKIGLFVIAPFDNSNLAIHIGGNGSVVGYTSEAGASKWYITKVVNAGDVDMSDNYRLLLENLIKQYQEYYSEIDQAGIQVGYLKPEASDIFDNYCEAINCALEDDNLDQNELANFYNNQLQIYKNLTQANSELRIGIEPGAAYVLQNVYTDKNSNVRLLFSDETYVSTTSVTDSKGFASQWIFEEAETPGLFAIRNMDNDKYVPALMDGTRHLPLTSNTPGYYGLIGVSDYLGQFGVGLEGKVSDVLVTAELEEPNQPGVVNRVALLSVLSGAESKWTLKRIHESEYVKLRDELIALLPEIRDIMSNNYEIPGMDLNEWLTLWFEIEDAVSTTGPTRNPETTLEELRDYIDKYEGTKARLQALINGDQIITVTNTIKSNDKVDNNESETEGKIRHAFNVSECINFDALMTLDGVDDPSNIIVDIQPIGSGQWLSSSAKNKADLMKDYQKEFSRSAPGSTLFKQLQSLECDYIDGYYTSISGKVVESETSDHYDLIISASCSGLYKVTLKGKEGYSIFTSDKRIPSFELEIYPNLKGEFNKDNGFNIEGFTFSRSDEALFKTIYLPEDFIKDHDMKSCTVYIPGIYFADEFTVANETDRSESNNYSMAVPYSTTAQSSNAGASKYFAKVDLSALNDRTEQSPTEKLNVSISKNGASSNYTFLVAVGNNGNVSTGIEEIVTNEEEPVYYNLQGVRINNPGHGIYIRKIGNKTEKIIM